VRREARRETPVGGLGGDLDSTSLSIACGLVPRALLGEVVRSGRAAVELLTLRRSWAFLASSASPRRVLSIKSGLPHESPRTCRVIEMGHSCGCPCCSCWCGWPCCGVAGEEVERGRAEFGCSVLVRRLWPSPQEERNEEWGGVRSGGRLRGGNR
jgi:hypothetical protein